MAGVHDPYQTLGVPPRASEDELRAAYRRLVQRHHPDHNGGSAEATRRFEEVQEAYARIRLERAKTSLRSTAGPSGRPPAGPSVRPADGADTAMDSRLAEMERELAAARAAREHAVKAAREREQARERARRAARAAADGTPGERPSDEELGYYKTDDSLSKIFSDAVSDLSDRLEPESDQSAAGPNRPVTGRYHVRRSLSDLIDELESKFGGQ